MVRRDRPAEPYTLLLVGSLAICIAIWRSKRWRGSARLVATVCFSVLLVLSTPVTKHLAIGSLEWWCGTEVVSPKP